MTSKDYSKGKIYKIEPIVEHEEGDIYIGSTTKQYLSQRMTSHRKDYTQWKNGKRGNVTSFQVFDKYGIENCIITLLEAVKANSSDELKKRERFYIQSCKCVNKRIEGRTKKEYEQDNIEHIRERKKIYEEKNKEKRNIQKKANSELHTNDRYICECGSNVNWKVKARHLRSEKHTNLINKII